VNGACAERATSDTPNCAGTSCRFDVVDASGAFEFPAGGLGSTSWTAHIRSTCTVPKTCLEGSMTCDQLAMRVANRTCTEQGASCACVQTDAISEMSAGAWSIQGGKMLQIVGGDGGASGSSNPFWCVRDTTLTMQGLAYGLGLDGIGVFFGTEISLTATRR
jgi:hypothetical protein